MKDFRYIKNKELNEAIKAAQNQKKEEEHFSEKGYFLGDYVQFDVDPEKIGNVFAFCPIFGQINAKSSFRVMAHMIIPIIIPNVQNIKEILDSFVSNKSFQFKLLPSIALTAGFDETIELSRYIFTNSLIILLESLVKVNDDDIIYNIIPPEGFKYGAFVIQESNKNGHTYKTLFDITDRRCIKMIRTNRPKEDINNDVDDIKNNNDHIIKLNSNSKKHAFHKKIKNKLVYTRLE